MDDKLDKSGAGQHPQIDPSNDADPLDGQGNGSTLVDKDSKKPGAKVLEKKIEHLELLSRFIETDLAHLLELQKQIEELTLESIEFEDLWYLFNPGDTLYTDENGHPQLYTTYMVTICHWVAARTRWRPAKMAKNHLFSMRIPPLLLILHAYYYSIYSYLYF